MVRLKGVLKRRAIGHVYSAFAESRAREDSTKAARGKSAEKIRSARGAKRQRKE